MQKIKLRFFIGDPGNKIFKGQPPPPPPPRRVLVLNINTMCNQPLTFFSVLFNSENFFDLMGIVWAQDARHIFS
jgi:hypothetical protein